MKTTSLKSLAALCALLSCHLQAQSSSPPLLPFQGRLTDANGAAIADGARVVQFKIYDAPVGGQAVWNGIHGVTSPHSTIRHVPAMAPTSFSSHHSVEC